MGVGILKIQGRAAEVVCRRDAMEGGGHEIARGQLYSCM